MTPLIFTFYFSSIKSHKIQSSLFFYHHLHSTLVLLKGVSIMYLLHAHVFTFYFSSIKSTVSHHLSRLFLPFTFYFSSIKAKYLPEETLELVEFTFYFSSIKSYPSFFCYYICFSYLHSTLVLLKDCLRILLMLCP